MSNKLKNRAYADLAHSQTWKNHLKPDLLKIKEMYTQSENEEDTIDKSAIRDIKRSTAVKIINRHHVFNA